MLAIGLVYLGKEKIKEPAPYRRLLPDDIHVFACEYHRLKIAKDHGRPLGLTVQQIPALPSTYRSVQPMRSAGELYPAGELEPVRPPLHELLNLVRPKRSPRGDEVNRLQ